MAAPSDNALQQLEAVVAYYHSVQLWILHTRAALDLANVDPQIIPIAKQEEQDVDLTTHLESSQLTQEECAATTTATKPIWARRRHHSVLRLANLSSAHPSSDRSSHNDHTASEQLSIPYSRTHSSRILLDMYNSLIDSRIQCCHRLALMVLRGSTNFSHNPGFE